MERLDQGKGTNPNKQQGHSFYVQLSESETDVRL